MSLPDAGCLSRGDEYVVLAQRCFAAGGLSDHGIASRFVARLGLEWAALSDDAPDTAAQAVARHGALSGIPERQIVQWLAWLSAELPAWPDDPDELATIARGAVAECAR
jgi:hypothetical protein